MILHKNKLGFTLVEIMIVVAIIGLLAAIAVPNFIQARTTTRTNICVNNLRLIDAAKEQWAMENNGDTGDTPDPLPYLRGNVLPTEPQGGAYNVAVVGTPPTCSLGGTHVLP